MGWEIKGIANRQSPVNHFQELPLEHVELSDTDTAYFGVEIVGAKCVAETFARDCDGRDDETMASE